MPPNAPPSSPKWTRRERIDSLGFGHQNPAHPGNRVGALACYELIIPSTTKPLDLAELCESRQIDLIDVRADRGKTILPLPARRWQFRARHGVVSNSTNSVCGTCDARYSMIRPPFSAQRGVEG